MYAIPKMDKSVFYFTTDIVGYRAEDHVTHSPTEVVAEYVLEDLFND